VKTQQNCIEKLSEPRAGSLRSSSTSD